MPNLPISGLPSSSTLQGDELFADVQGGVTKYTTLDNVTSYVSSSIEVYNQTNPNNSYIVPVTLTVSAGDTINLSDSVYQNTSMIELSWSGGTNPDVTLNLPDATNPNNTYRTIRFISDSTFLNASHHVDLTPTGGQTLDGSTNPYVINKEYEGIMVWSDGVEWFVIQKKSG
tara:strand:+ start:300 stop:815 length:516 start_codon:yes stop_codon:yes gene_type:complete